MTTMEIVLSGGAVNAHQRFTVQLGDRSIEFRLDYQQTGQWACDLFEEGQRLCSGAMLEPNADVIEFFNLGIGKLIFTGDDTTLDNLGQLNKLVWVSP